MYLRNNDLEITLEIKDLRHFRIRSAKDLKQFTDAFSGKKSRKIGFSTRENATRRQKN